MKPDILLQHLSKSFGPKVVLQDLTCTFPTGQVSACMAPSGTGKTTLLRILMGLETADQGEIQGLSAYRLAVQFQEDRLSDHLDAEANIRLVSPHLTAMEIGAALEAVSLTDCQGQPAEELSGGQKRRIALLRALLSEGDLLLLDEPFRGLDAATKETVMAYTRALCQGRTTILVTHDEAEAQALGAKVLLRL